MPYDVTSSYLEGRCCALARCGYSRDGLCAADGYRSSWRCSTATPPIQRRWPPSTAVHDRGLRLDDYCRPASVRGVLLISSTERRVQYWRREGHARW